MVCRPVQPHLSKMSQSGPLLLSLRHSLAFKYIFFKFMHTNKPCRLLRKAAFLDFGGGFFSLGFFWFLLLQKMAHGVYAQEMFCF